MLTCHFCEEFTIESSRYVLSRHMKECVKKFMRNEEFVCDKCSYSKCKTYRSFSMHYRKCTSTLSKKKYCHLCNEQFSSKEEYRAHNKIVGHAPKDFIRDKSSQTRVDRTCRHCHKVLSTTSTGIKNHENLCLSNPHHRTIARDPLSEGQRQHLSEVMKQRHAENKASRWQNPSLHESYAERFFKQVIANEFEDKAYVRELPVGRYFFDFAWPAKMKAIEIDGAHHERFAHQRLSDERKDAFTASLGWTTLRIRWSDLYRDPKTFIAKARHFIDS